MRLLLGLLVAGLAVGQTPAALSETEQDQLLDRMHQYADKYVNNLPNFICDLVTKESESTGKPGKWARGDTLVSKLSFHDGQEARIVETSNGRKVKPGREARPLALNTEGEFGGLLRQVLGNESQAYFKWNRWETIREKRLAVFDFSVDQDRSIMSLHLGKVVAIVGYEGSVYADPESGAVWRFSYTAKNIPAKIETRQISTSVDYGLETIGQRSYMLPVAATVTWLLWTKQIRNEMEFKGYRKFEADTSIHYDSSEAPK